MMDAQIAAMQGVDSPDDDANREQWNVADEHSPNLDSLRTLAVGFVVLSHVLLEHAFTSIADYHVQSLGTLGVMIFFVHTCLVLMKSLERQVQSSGYRLLALSFLITRAFRIYPLSIFVVLTLVVIQLIFSDAQIGVLSLLSNLFLVQNLTGAASITPVLWSLPFEFQMYFFLPMLFSLAALGRERAWLWLVMIWCGIVGLILLLRQLGISVELIRYFPCFLPGVLAYCLRCSQRCLSSLFLFGFVLLAAAIFPLLVGKGLSATGLGWLTCLGLGFLIPKCRNVQTKWIQQCSDTVARYSYGIYLVHVPMLYLSFSYFKALPVWLAWGLFVGGSALASYLAYHCIEKPGIAYGRLLAQRMRAGQAPHPRSA